MLGMCLIGLSGCGNTADPIADEEYDGTYDEDLEDEYDPYIDGLSLEEAKEGDYGTMFIKDNLLYYPLIPSYDSDYISGVTSEEAKASEESGYDDSTALMQWYKVSPEYADYDLPILTESTQLVEVFNEDGGYMSKISDNRQYTLPCIISYSLESGYDGEKMEADWSKLFDDEMSGYTIKSIDGKEIENKELDRFALSSPQENCFEELTENERNYFNSFNWNSLYTENGLKPVDISPGWDGGMSATFLFIKEKGESVSLKYRTDGDVNSHQEEINADVAIYNMPEDISHYKKPERYELAYEQTDEGYSIIKTDDLPAGAFATDSGFLFRKK